MMKLTLDFNTRTVTLDSPVNCIDFADKMMEILPDDYKNWTITPSFTAYTYPIYQEPQPVTEPYFTITSTNEA